MQPYFMIIIHTNTYEHIFELNDLPLILKLWCLRSSNSDIESAFKNESFIWSLEGINVFSKKISNWVKNNEL